VKLDLKQAIEKWGFGTFRFEFRISWWWQIFESVSSF